MQRAGVLNYCDAVFRVSILSVIFWSFLCGGIVLAQELQYGNTTSETGNTDEMLEFISGPVESITETLIKVYGTEYYFTMETSYIDMAELPIDEQLIQIGDIVVVTFDRPGNIVDSVMLEVKKSDIVEPFMGKNIKRSKENEVITYENGVYKN